MANEVIERSEGQMTDADTKDFYCTYTAAIGNPVGLADPTYQGEMDVTATDEADAEAKVEQRLAQTHPGDRLLSCSCKEFA